MEVLRLLSAVPPLFRAWAAGMRASVVVASAFVASAVVASAIFPSAFVASAVAASVVVASAFVASVVVALRLQSTGSVVVVHRRGCSST